MRDAHCAAVPLDVRRAAHQVMSTLGASRTAHRASRTPMPDTPLPPVEINDRYRIEREIGRGGMAVVYLADDLRHGRKVAIKFIQPELAQAVGAARFLREIEIAARLTHPHIVPLFDSGETDGRLFYVMPFLEGESLR